MNSDEIKKVNDRIERIETALGLAGIELPEKVAEITLTSDLPTDIFKDWEKGIRSKLADIIVAPEDVTKELAGGIGIKRKGKMYFTYDEAMELEEKVLKPNGWRLPTRSEWVLLAEEFGQNENGELDAHVLMDNLCLPLTGDVWSGSLRNGTTNGLYWSRVSSSDTFAYNLNFNTSGGVYPQDYDYKMNGFAVRAVKDIKEEG